MKLEYSEKAKQSAMSEFRDKKIGDGKRGPFYNRTQEWDFEKDDLELFKNAVWQGYLDASRTFTGIKGTNKDEDAFLNLAKSIKKYFDVEGSEFTHDKWCKDFIRDIKKYNGYDARYGQAQKVVNMTFKYLYCCHGAEIYRDSKFNECHMPLDQFTLAWFFTEEGILYQEWSWFSEDLYKKVTEKIRKILKDDILGKELIIWNKYKDSIVNLKKIHK